MKTVIRSLRLLSLAFVLTLGLISGIAHAQPYGSGGYGSCEYQDCTTTNTSTSATSSAQKSTPSPDATSTTDTPKAGTQSETSSTSQKTTSLASTASNRLVWFQWAALALSVLLFAWLIIGIKRRRKTDENQQ